MHSRPVAALHTPSAVIVIPLRPVRLAATAWLSQGGTTRNTVDTLAASRVGSHRRSSNATAERENAVPVAGASNGPSRLQNWSVLSLLLHLQSGTRGTTSRSLGMN
jgi:hypothetical protein